MKQPPKHVADGIDGIDDGDDDAELSTDSVVEIPIDGELDLHLFSPKDMGTLVPDYLMECRRRDILEVRIIHGKGTGALKKGVHAILGRLDYVLNIGTPGQEAGGWGATRVDLAPMSKTEPFDVD